MDREMKVRGFYDGKMLPVIDVSSPRHTWDWFGEADAELMWFTGLKDKNGVDIYESDIVKILQTDWMSKSDSDPRTLEEYLDSLTSKYVINFRAGLWGAEFTAILDGEHHHSIYCGAHGYIEVIGNIHQNPELVK